MNIKNNQTNASKKLGKLPIWSLKDLYLSQNDKSLSRDLNNIKNGTLKFEKKYLNKVKSLSAENLYTAIIHLEQIDVLMDKVLSYAHLLVAEDGNNEKNKIFYQQMQEKITNFASSIIFFTLELNQIPEKQISKLVKNQKLQIYKNWIINKRSFKPYQLDLKIEKILQDKSITSHSAWIRLFDDLIASLKFPFKKEELNKEILSKIKSLTNSLRGVSMDVYDYKTALIVIKDFKNKEKANFARDFLKEKTNLLRLKNNFVILSSQYKNMLIYKTLDLYKE